MDIEDNKQMNSPEREDSYHSSRRNRSPSPRSSRRSHSRDRDYRQSSHRYKYDDGRNSRNDGNTLYALLIFASCFRYIGNLPYRADEEAVREIFEQFGPVKNVTIPKDIEKSNR